MGGCVKFDCKQLGVEEGEAKFQCTASEGGTGFEGGQKCSSLVCNCRAGQNACACHFQISTPSPAINNDHSLTGVIKWIGAHGCINEPQGRGNWGRGTLLCKGNSLSYRNGIQISVCWYTV